MLWGRRIGAVSWLNERDVGVFQYTPEFVGSNIQVAPLTMPLRETPYEFPALSRGTFSGLPGLLADSLPDKFGNALIDKALSNLTFSRKHDISKRSKAKKKNKLCFTYTCSKAVAKARIDASLASLQKHASLIHKDIHDCKITSAGKCAPNLFRLMYSYTWHSGG